MARAHLDFALERPQLFRLMFVSDLLSGGVSHDPDLVMAADADYEWVKSLVAKACASSDRRVSAATIALWSGLHGFAMLRMGERLKGFMLGGPCAIVFAALAHGGVRLFAPVSAAPLRVGLATIDQPNRSMNGAKVDPIGTAI